MGRYLRFGLLLWLSLLPAGFIFLQAQAVQGEMTADTGLIRIGEQLHLKIHLEQEAGYQLIWPQVVDSLGGMEVLSISETDTSLRDGKLILEKVLTLTAFEEGNYRIPPLEIAYRKAGDPSGGKLRLSSLTILVQTVPVDTLQEILPIRDPVSIPWSLKEILSVAGPVLALLLIALFIWYRLSRRRKMARDAEKPAVPARPAHLIALEALDRLDSEKRWQKGDVKAYYIRLTEILRDYIERGFGIPALESTTDELLVAFSGRLGQAPRADLEKVLRQADLVKFAKSRPGSEENTENLSLSKKFVQDTIPLTAPPPEVEKES
jgi:hypothetical protein